MSVFWAAFILGVFTYTAAKLSYVWSRMQYYGV